jgi:hypothetical protein
VKVFSKTDCSSTVANYSKSTASYVQYILNTVFIGIIYASAHKIAYAHLRVGTIVDQCHCARDCL